MSNAFGIIKSLVREACGDISGCNGYGCSGLCSGDEYIICVAELDVSGLGSGTGCIRAVCISDVYTGEMGVSGLCVVELGVAGLFAVLGVTNPTLLYTQAPKKRKIKERKEEEGTFRHLPGGGGRGGGGSGSSCGAWPSRRLYLCRKSHRKAGGPCSTALRLKTLIHWGFCLEG